MDIKRFRLDGDETPIVAVSLSRARNDHPYCNFHTGIVYRRQSDDNVYWLHLAWHKTLCHQLNDGMNACAIPPINEDKAYFFAEFALLVAECVNNKEIPYSIGCDPDLHFDLATGEFQSPYVGAGLNCATFVLAVFRSVGIPLATIDSWPSVADETDLSVQTALVATLKRSSRADGRQQGETEESNIGGRRIKPEEVFGSCLEFRIPASYPECQRNGHQVNGMLSRKCDPGSCY